MIQLRECPFCGRTNSVALVTAKEVEDCKRFENDEKCPEYLPFGGPDNCRMYAVCCGVGDKGCGSMSGYWKSPEKAAEAWNRRATKGLPDGAKIRIRYHADIDHVEKISKGDWIDLRAAEEVELKAGEFKMFPLGVSMELPSGYEALCVPRSSTFRKYGVILVNSVGVIDETFRGDHDVWQFLAYAVRDTIIPKNERICQFRIIEHQPDIEFIEVDELGNEDRGGIGSTGRV